MKKDLLDGYYLSDQTEQVDIECVHKYLSIESYWGQGRSFETVRQSIENSLCLGVYDKNGAQAGFARVVTDYATFAWICDVFVLPQAKGKGFGKTLIREIVAHPRLQGLKRVLLATEDAHGLYEQYGGFEKLPNPERWMARTTEQHRK